MNQNINLTNTASRRPRTAARLVSGIAALTLASSLTIAPGTALASSGTTQVYFSADDSQISVTVPQTLPVSVNGDGTLVVPDLAIQNNSVFDIHVSSIKATPKEGFSIVEQSAFSGTSGVENALWMSLTPAGGSAFDLGASVDSGASTTAAQWHIDKKDSAGTSGSLTVSGDGAIKDFTRISTEGENAFDVTFTVKAG